MGTTARILAFGGPPEAVDRAHDSLAAMEGAWSRFRPESELSLLNAASGGRPVLVSPSTFALIARAVDAWRRTGGRFDPTGLAAIRAWGYDRDFAEVNAPAGDSGPIGPSVPLLGCADIGLDPLVRAVTLPVGTTLDLGGIGKGYAADLVAAELMAAGAISVCVDLGGDLRVMGPGPYDGAWETTFEDPVLSDQLGRLRFADGAVATSTRMRRRWRRGDVELHHLLDPSTGAPAESGLATVTVIASEAWWAEVLAKAAFVAGAADGCALLEDAGVDGVLIADDGTITETRGMTSYRAGAVTS
jgi:Membrane-associated lipoprotein involved in thiamine biosynthesis